jgi:hypothetical protein
MRGTRNRMPLTNVAALVALFIVGSSTTYAAAGLSRETAAETTPEPRVLVSTTGNESERVRTIPITRQQGREKRVVMSMDPQEVPEFVRGDRMKVTAEVQFTLNCLPEQRQERRCIGPAYNYDPVVRTSLVLAQGDETTGGERAVRISPMKRNICRQRLPFREHHCVVTFTEAGFTLRAGEPPPCPPDSCRVNLVAEADHPNARSAHKLIVGGLKATGAILQDRGRINAIRFHPGDQPEIPEAQTKVRMQEEVVPDLQKHVVYSQPLLHLGAGEQLEVSGKLETDISHLTYNTLTSVELILAARPEATGSSDAVKRVAALDGEIAEQNGFNCTQNRPSCTFPKVGVLQMEQAADRPLFVNLVASFNAKRTAPAFGDMVIVTGRGGLSVARFPAELKG